MRFAFHWSLLLMTLALPITASHAELPDDVWFKGNQQSFNNVYYAAVQRGDIWIKSNRQMTGIDSDWQKLALPAELAGQVTEIAFDDEHILALNMQREVFTLWNGLDAPTRFRWQKAWGLPFWHGPGLTLPEHFKKWDFSVVSPRLDEYYVDPAGHHLPVGVAKVSHIIAIKPDGRNVSYNDPWLPIDWSYEICGPERGRFPIHAASASGSTTFVLGKFGDMYTRVYDFDLSGHDDMFKYSYADQSQVKPVPNLPQPLYVLFNATQLPAFPWIRQPKIAGRITDRLSIHKMGKGVVNRILRVEGWNAAGDSGFYEKEMTQTASGDWVFHPTHASIEGVEIPNPDQDLSSTELLPSEDIAFYRAARRDLWSRWRHEDWAARVSGVNQYCSPAELTIVAANGDEISVTLHQIEKIRVTPRLRGFSDKRVRQGGALEIPLATWNRRQELPPTFRHWLAKYFGNSRIKEVKVLISEQRMSVSGAGLKWIFQRSPDNDDGP